MHHEFAVQGMTCGACVRHVEQALGAVEGVVHVAVTLAAGRVRVNGSADPGQLGAALEDAGYPARLVDSTSSADAPTGQPASRGCCCG